MIDQQYLAIVASIGFGFGIASAVALWFQFGEIARLKIRIRRLEDEWHQPLAWLDDAIVNIPAYLRKDTTV